MYPEISLFIDGAWCKASNGASENVINPATGDVIGQVPFASRDDLERAVGAAERGFAHWRQVSAFERYKIMRKAAMILRERGPEIAKVMTLEQGKPVGEAQLEAMGGADMIDWYAEEGRRTYGRVVPGRAPGVSQLVLREPVGPVAAFTPWNFPIGQAVRKISGALASGCSIVLKGPENTPASCAALVRAFVDAGVPKGVVNLVFGIPSEVSEYLIPHPMIRKVSFTGSTAVGKQLASMAGQHMKRVTMELGGHAPVIIFDDADMNTALTLLATAKYRNAGQVCLAPTRFLVQENVYRSFLEKFVAAAKAVKVGDGMEKGVNMGPLAHSRRLETVEALVSDAVEKGARIQTGGRRIGNKGFFFEPTVLTDVPRDARIMNEEPFGPLAPIAPFKDVEEAVLESNRLAYGLAAYAYTGSANTATAISAAVDAGMISINHHGLGLPEVPLGGVKDSGYGSEGGAEALEGFLTTKFVTQRFLQTGT